MAAEPNVLASDALAVAAAIGGLSAVLALILASRRPAMLAAVAACIGILVAGAGVILGPAIVVRAGEVLGYRVIDLRFDGLSGVFLIALGSVGAAASLYALGYHDAGRSRFDSLAYVAFLAGMTLVFGAANAFTFLFGWELMAVASAILVLGPRPGRSVVRAGYVYIAMSHVATAAIAVAFAWWSTASGSVDFTTWRAGAAALGSPGRDLVFLLLLVGFGTKAGIMPLHVWLPRAHPVAPSHVSALMSGVMVKAGIFGIIRFGIEYLGGGPAWWGVLVLALGAASAVLGVLYALSEHDLKRLLAFSTIENVGIILLGLGVALVGTGAGIPALVVGGLAAALFHTVNHALFKALLFLGAGAVQETAHSRDLNRLGGLARVMPLIALSFGVGAAAISGLPPLNGFASEWLTLQALLGAGSAGGLDTVARFTCDLAVGAVALAAALAVAAFVKATGMTFLARPRSEETARAVDVGRSMRAAVVVLAGVCLGLGVGAAPAGAVLADVARSVEGAGNGSVAALVAPPAIGPYQPALLAAGLGLLLVAIAAITRLGARPARRAPTWTSGVRPEPAFEYTATSFSKPVRLFFEPVLRPDRELLVELHEGTPFPRRVTYRSEIDHLIESRLYGPVHRAAISFAQAARRVQQGTLQLYLAYTVGTIVILLLVVRR